MNDAHINFQDEVEDRRGQWMQTSLGNKFFPEDPRSEEVFISDIANGLALDCRYAGQGAVDKFYSVAEHSYHMTAYASGTLEWPPEALLACLLHDAAEAYCNDLPRAVKQAVNNVGDDEYSPAEAYSMIEDNIQAVIEMRYSLPVDWEVEIKDLDRRIVPLEKAAIMRYPQPWAHDQFEPLEGIEIKCWRPPVAKQMFLNMYNAICLEGGFEREGYEI